MRQEKTIKHDTKSLKTHTKPNAHQRPNCCEILMELYNFTETSKIYAWTTKKKEKKNTQQQHLIILFQSVRIIFFSVSLLLITFNTNKWWNKPKC